MDNPLFHHDLAHLHDLQRRKADADEAYASLRAWNERLATKARNEEPIARKELDLFQQAFELMKTEYANLARELGITEPELEAAVAAWKDELMLPEELMGNRRMGVA